MAIGLMVVEITYYKRKLLNVCNHPAKFGSHNHCHSGDITYLICHVTLQDNVIKGSCDYLERSSLCVTILPDLGVMGILVMEMFLIHHMTPCDHMFRRLC